MPDSILRWEILTEETVDKGNVLKLTARHRYERVGPTTNSLAVSTAFVSEPRNAG